jgi:hypothetical protein
MNDFKPLTTEGTALMAAQSTAFAQKQKGTGTPATNTECTYNKEYFADKECHTCGKKGYPSRCCLPKKGKAKKDLEDDKLVSSNKSAKTIKSLTKQVKNWKKSVSILQALSPAWRETRIFNMHVQPLLLLIRRWPWLSSPIRHGIWISGVCGSWIISLHLTYVATLILLTNGGTQKGQWTCQVMVVDFVSPRNVRFLVMIFRFGSLNRQQLIFFDLIRLYWVTNDSEWRMAFIVHREEFGLPKMVFDMHPCGLHIYYPKKIDELYGFVQTVADNMKLFTKQQIEGALKVHHLYETLGYPSNVNFETVLRAGSIGGCTLTADNAKVAYKIWGNSVPRLKGSTVRETGHHKPQSLVKVPWELVQLQQKVRIGIDIFFVNGHIFFMT